MLTKAEVRATVENEIRSILLEDDQEVDTLTGQEQLVELGLNSLLLARLIVALEIAFEIDIFTNEEVEITDMRSVNDLVALYEAALIKQIA